MVSGGEDAPQIATIAVESLRERWSESTLEGIARILPNILRKRRWFLGRNKTITQVTVEDVVPLGRTDASIMLVRVEYSDSEDERYVIPLAVAAGTEAEAVLRDHPPAVVVRLEFRDQSWALLHSALFERSFSDALLTAILKRSKFKGTEGELVAGHTKAFRDAWAHIRSNREPQVQTLDSPNTFVNLGEDFVVKLYRAVEAGTNPDREISEFLTEKTDFVHMPKALGWLDYCQHRDDEDQVTTLGLLTGFLRNATSGWQYTLDHLSLYFEHALAVHEEDSRAKDVKNGSPLVLAKLPVPALMAELLGTYENTVHLMGVRTAELHAALSSRPEVPDFSPEPFTDFYRHGLYHGMLGLMGRSLDSLRVQLKTLPEAVSAVAEALLAREADIRKELLPLRDLRISGARIRIHGDYQLGNVLFTGNDVVIQNFDGPTGRPLSERRIKRSALRDVASMIRSLHYAAHAVSFGYVPGVVKGREQVARIDHWAEHWHEWVSAMFLQGYLETSAGMDFLPKTEIETRALLRAHLIEKSLLEIAYELEYRPEWVGIPVHGLASLLNW
jgi:maltose alpha-D-glucosyltransferase/alpha-amylase